LIASYPSGSIASQALGIQQGDISLCCRGLKPSIGNYKFKFAADLDDSSDTTKLKRGYALEPIPAEAVEKVEVTAPSRNSRTSRGEYSSFFDKDPYQSDDYNIQELATVKVSYHDLSPCCLYATCR
jgi:hypothetical protein